MPGLSVQLAAARQSRSDLCSSSTSAYCLSTSAAQDKIKFGECAFSHAGPVVHVERTAQPRPRRS